MCDGVPFCSVNDWSKNAHTFSWNLIVITFIIIKTDACFHIQKIHGSIPNQNTDHPESLPRQENSGLGP